MSKQPEALRLARDLESFFVSEDVSAVKASEIAAELRRLHSVNAELLEALRNFVDFPSDMFDGDHDAPFTMTVRIANMRLARAAIAKAEEA